MRNIAILLLLGASIAGAAQAAPAAAQNSPAGALPAGVPPEVDAALRDRVTKFFQAQANRKYRQADQYVAEDTKDYFYLMTKVPILKCEIAKIAYSDNFTKAVVTVRIERELSEALIPKMRLNVQESSDWKIENGQWCWTVDQSVIQTPFGPMKNLGAARAGEGPGTPPAPAIPNVADLSKGVAADKTEVELGERKTDQVVLRNPMPGPITLSLEVPETPGLQVKLDHAEVAPNGAARLLFAYDSAAGGAAEGKVTVNVTVQPTSQVIPIQVKLKPVSAAGK